MKKLGKDSGNNLDSCSQCHSSSSFLKSEVELLRQKLIDRNIKIIQMEARMTQELPHIYSQGHLAALRTSCDNWQDKYERLLEAHKRLQRVNQGLEDKLLLLVDRTESEKAKLSQDAVNLTTALTTAAQAINRLKNENARYQNDLGVAVQLLQCNSSQYTSQKLNSLPLELHQKIKSRLVPETPKKQKTEAKVIRVPIPTFPPTAMVYSVNKFTDKEEQEEPVDMVSAAIMAAILEERERERSQRHCPTCTCKIPSEGNHTSQKTNSDHVDEYSTFRAINENVKSVHNGGSNLGHSPLGQNSNSYGVSAIDVGTQTIPSYIGETGKVRSTCIYCQSSKAIGDRGTSSIDSSSLSNVSVESPSLSHSRNLGKDAQPSKFPLNALKNDNLVRNKEKSDSRQHTACPWDWHTESQDSGSPPTPTSLTSASLSYESETSCFTSPQDSPGHISFQSISLNRNKEEKAQAASGMDYSDAEQDGNASAARAHEAKCSLYGRPLHDQFVPASAALSNGKSSKHQMRKNSLKTVAASRLDKPVCNGNLSLSQRHTFSIPSTEQNAYTTPVHMSPPLRLSTSSVESASNDFLIEEEPMICNNSYNSIDSATIDRFDSDANTNAETPSQMRTTEHNNDTSQEHNEVQTFSNETLDNINFSLVFESLKGETFDDISFYHSTTNCTDKTQVMSNTFTRSARETSL